MTEFRGDYVFQSVGVQGPVSADELVDTVKDRPEWTTSDTTVNVPGDYDTIQAALDDVPVVLNHNYEITIDAGDYTGEGALQTRPSVGGYTGGNAGLGWEHKLTITGDTTTPSNVKIHSLLFDGFYGGFARAQGVQTEAGTTLDDEGAALSAYHCNSFDFTDCNIRSSVAQPAHGVVAYASDGQVNNVDFGAGDIKRNGIHAKHTASVLEQNAAATPSSGSVPGTPYQARAATAVIAFAGNDSTLSTSGSSQWAGGNGRVWDYQNERLHNRHTPRNDVHYTFEYVGADPDARLDSLLTNVVAGDTVVLEDGVYDANRTISTQELTFVSENGKATGARIDNATWTLNASHITLDGVSIKAGGTLDMSGAVCVLKNAAHDSTGTINVNAARCKVLDCDLGDVTFSAGNSGGLVDSCTGTGFTDNDGGNLMGDIA